MYEEIYKAWENELENPVLKALPRDFYVKLGSYTKGILEEKRRLDDKSLKFRLMTEEYDNVKKLITDLSDLRFKKIISHAYQGKVIPEATLIGEEEVFFEKVNSAVMFSSRLLKDLIEGQLPPVENVGTEKKPKRILVRFIRDIPAIIGVDMEPYGPFKAEDVATIPPENVENLIRQGAAVKLEVEDR
jgi:DNA replication factor GINS